jgi:hypothetical protein
MREVTTVCNSRCRRDKLIHAPPSIEAYFAAQPDDRGDLFGDLLQELFLEIQVGGVEMAHGVSYATEHPHITPEKWCPPEAGGRVMLHLLLDAAPVQRENNGVFLQCLSPGDPKTVLEQLGRRATIREFKLNLTQSRNSFLEDLPISK